MLRHLSHTNQIFSILYHKSTFLSTAYFKRKKFATICHHLPVTTRFISLRTACHWGVTSHPHYHDCENCDHARYGNCDIGKAFVERKQNEAFRARAKEIINSLPPYPSLDPKRLP